MTPWHNACDVHGHVLRTSYNLPVLYSYLLGGVVVLSVECRTCDQEVVDSSLGRARDVKTLGKFLTPMCLCSPSTISWYRPKSGDPLWLGSKGRYGSCVGGR